LAKDKTGENQKFINNLLIFLVFSPTWSCLKNMQKKNIKSFICSFIFSILMVFTLQKLFLHTPEIKNETKENIPLKKISLFSEKNDLKVAKTTFNDKSKAKIDVSEIASLTVPDLPEISAQETANSNETPTPAMSSSSDIQTDIAFADEIMFDPNEMLEIKENQAHINKGIVYGNTSLNSEDVDLSSELALNDVEDIPLFESTEQSSKEILIANASQSSRIAMVEPQALISTIEEEDILNEEKNLAEADIKKSELGDMFAVSEKTDTDENTSPSSSEEETVSSSSLENSPQEDNPWVMAKGNKFAKNRAIIEAFAENPESNEEEKEEKVSKNETVEKTFTEPLLKEKETQTQLAYQMIQNILIPIPDDVLSDSDLTPDLSETPKDGEKSKKTTPKPAVQKAPLSDQEKQSGLFQNISSWFGKNKNADTKKSKDQIAKDSGSDKPSNYKPLGSVKDYQKTASSNILPAELRLSFQPNRAEISGQTLRWIYAFADNARDNDDIYIEIRIDGTSSYALQQKRLNLLSSIFSSRGVDYRKINTIFTSREPNSFIIRNIRFNNKEQGETNK